MIASNINQEEFYSSLDKIGFKDRIKREKSVLIKINLSRPAKPEHPRTDSKLLADVIHYIYTYGGTCAIAESANGYLRQNLEYTGLSDTIKKFNVDVIDLDFEEVDKISINGEEHYLPKCFRNYGARIAIPATSKRPSMVFSNNVKLFVGAVPRRMYQLDNISVDWRPRVHVNLHKSVANIFNAIQSYSPFCLFINGGLAMSEEKGEFRFDDILLGHDAVELDLYVLRKYFNGFEIPEYLKLLCNI